MAPYIAVVVELSLPQRLRKRRVHQFMDERTPCTCLDSAPTRLLGTDKIKMEVVGAVTCNLSNRS